MENFDFKRMMQGFLLCMLIMYGWMFLEKKFNPPAPETTPAAPTAAPAAKPTAKTPAAAASLQAAEAPGRWKFRTPAKTDAPAIVLGDRAKESGYKAQILLDPATASVSEVLLSEHKFKVDDEQTGYPLLKPVVDIQQREIRSFLLGKLTVEGAAATLDLSEPVWSLTKHLTDEKGGTETEFTAVLENDKGGAALEIRKIFRYQRDSYDVSLELVFENKTAAPLNIQSLEFFGPAGVTREEPRSDSDRFILAAYLDKDQKLEVKRADVASMAKKPEKGKFQMPGGASTLSWFGYANKFFAAIVHPVPVDAAGTMNYIVRNEVQAAGFTVSENKSADQPAKPLAIQTLVGFPQPLPANASQSCTFEIYLGVIDKEFFDDPAHPQYRKLQFEKLVNVSWCSFAWLTFLLLKIMNGVYAIVGNYGIAIIVLVLLVRLILHPISKRSQVNMMKMSKLGPQVEEVKKKYAGNPQEIQKRTMEIYKQQGAAPILGCLPMLLQMPIWVALYSAVSTNVGLRHQGLFPASWHWLNDLSAPDRLIPLSVFGIKHIIEIPLVGGVDAINILPILLCVAMFLQQKLMPQSTAPQTNPQMAQQQKMMLIMMPVMMLVFFYVAPSGLNLYIMASTFGGLIESHFIRKHIKEQEARESAVTVTTTKKLSGLLGPKKKKPKPPIKFT